MSSFVADRDLACRDAGAFSLQTESKLRKQTSVAVWPTSPGTLDRTSGKLSQFYDRVMARLLLSWPEMKLLSAPLPDAVQHFVFHYSSTSRAVHKRFDYSPTQCGLCRPDHRDQWLELVVTSKFWRRHHHLHRLPRPGRQLCERASSPRAGRPTRSATSSAFLCSFSAGPGRPDLFRALSAAGIDQQAAFNTLFGITANNAASEITQFGVFITGYNSLDPYGPGDIAPSVRVNQGILDGGNTVRTTPSRSDVALPQPGVCRRHYTALVQRGFRLPDQLGSGRCFEPLTSFTGYYLPAGPTVTPVPEPATVLTIGAGLAAIARRRLRGRP